MKAWKIWGRARTHVFGYDAFISHTGSGRDYAEKLAEALTREGWSCFLDRSELHAGHGLEGTIATALAKSALLIVVVSERPFAAPWPRAETTFFRSARPGGRIIPVVVDREGDGGDVKWDEVFSDLEQPVGQPDLYGHWRPSLTDRVRLLRSRHRVRRDGRLLGIEDDSRTEPSETAVNRIKRSRDWTKVEILARRSASAVAVALIMALAAVGWFAVARARDLPNIAVADASETLEGFGFDVGGVEHNSHETRPVVIRFAKEPGTRRWNDLSNSQRALIGDALRRIDRHRDIDSLDLTGFKLDDLNAIGPLHSVETLKLQDCPIIAINDLGGWTRLRALDLSFNKLAPDGYRGLATAPGLRELFVTTSNGFGDDAVQGLPSLVELSASNCPRLTTAGIRRLRPESLRRLRISGTGVAVNDELVDALDRFDRLTLLDVSAEGADGEALARLRTLAEERNIQLYGVAQEIAPGTVTEPEVYGGTFQ